MKKIDKAVLILKELIEINGPDYIKKNPYKAYEILIKDIDQKLSLAIFGFLTSYEENILENDNKSFSKEIQIQLGFKKNVTDELIEVLRKLYSKENKESWADKEGLGLSEFLSSTLIFNWSGYEIWDYGSVTMDCHFNSIIELKPNKKSVKNKEIDKLIKENPFVSKEKIEEIYIKDLNNYLNKEFNYYCQADDYYPPVVEDFDVDCKLKMWCKSKGFRVVKCEGDGYDDGYEPKTYHTSF